MTITEIADKAEKRLLLRKGLTGGEIAERMSKALCDEFTGRGISKGLALLVTEGRAAVDRSGRKPVYCKLEA
jgi:hypothetical protein